MLRGAIIIFVFAVLPPECAAGPRFGLWAEAEGTHRPYRSREEMVSFLEYTEDRRLTDIYTQVYRNGRAWFPSMMADDAPYRAAVNQGFDPLRETIDKARSRGQRVHAWLNVLRVISNREAPLIRTVGPEAVLRDHYGNSLLDYNDAGIGPGQSGRAYQLGTPGLWLEPGNRKVREYLVETVRDLLISYPDLDGIHLDMMRMPYAIGRRGGSGGGERTSFGYSEAAIRDFFEYTGRPMPPMTPELIQSLRQSTTWHTWKRAQVTLTVFQIRELLNRMAPEMELSAAVLGSSHTAYNYAYQDWAAWLRGGIIDSVVLMSYNRDVQQIRRQSQAAVRSSRRGQVVVGLGAWLMVNEPNLLISQGRAALDAGAAGTALFSYSNLFSPNGKRTYHAYAESLYPAPK